MPPFSRLQLGCLLVLWSLMFPAASGAQINEENEALEARIHKYLPRLLPKLQRRARIRVVVVGDSISNFFIPGATVNPQLTNAWYMRFLNQLAGHFYYTGGVREDVPKPSEVVTDSVVDFKDAAAMEQLPTRGELPRLDSVAIGGPEFLLRNFGRNGAISMQALQVLTTEGFDDDPDLVIWMYGTNDATMGVQVERYRQALAQVIKLCQARQAELIVAGPPLVYGTGIGELAMTQPYVEAARTLAKESQLLFVDMSAALGKIPLQQPFDPETVLPKYVEEVGKYYSHPGQVDRLHPNALGHEVMGQALWQALLHGPVPDPLEPRGSWTHADKAAAQPQFEILIYQPPTEVLPPPPMESVAISVLGQPGGWQRAGGPTFVVKEFTGKRMTTMPMEPIPGSPHRAPLGEHTVGTVILHEGAYSRLTNLTLPIFPIALELPVARMDGVAGSLLIDSFVFNRQKSDLRATVNVSWLETQFNLELAIAAGESKPLKLRLPLPDAPSAHGPLKVTIQAGEQQYVFERMIDARQSFLPGQSYALHNQVETPTDPTISINVDPVGLYLRFELPPMKLVDEVPLSAVITLLIDARGASEMAQPGFVDRWNFDVPWVDGPIHVRKPRLGTFGNGYDRQINPANIRAALKTENTGQRIVTVDIPKNYFYLHEWSLATNGQNTLGINAGISLLDATTSPPSFPLSAFWSLMPGGFQIHDAGSVGLLQLNSAKTGAWSVRIH